MPRARLGLPYENAKVKPENARAEIGKLLEKLGCESVGFVDNYNDGTVTLGFSHRGKTVRMEVSATGYAAQYRARRKLPRSMADRAALNDKALKQGRIAVNAILRDWVKGQMMAVECGMMPFDAVFLPYMITNDGRPLHERMSSLNLLAPPRKE